RTSEQRTVIGDVPLHVPVVGQDRQGLRSGSEIKVRIRQIKAGCTVELGSSVLAEVRLEHHFLPRTGAVARRREFESLRGLRKKRELVISKERHHAGLLPRTRHQWLRRHLELCANLPVRAL